MSDLTPDSIRSACNGAWAARPAGGDARASDVRGFSIDSRTIQPGEVFIAIRGERTDGHHYLADALAKGAAGVIVEDPASIAGISLDEGVWAIRVTDTLNALARLARAHRRALDGVRVVAVTGSAGKTTTVRLIEGVLSSRLRGVASVKSFNNEIGVPLTMLRAKRSDQFLLCEVGANAPGEIAALAELLEPDVAVITTIGRAHLEGFGSIEGVAREKAALLAYLRPGGCAVVGPHNGLLDDALSAAPNVVRVGRDEHNDLRVSDVHHAGDPPTGVRFTVNGQNEYEAPVLGEHNAVNAAIAAAVGRRLGLDDDAVREGLANAAPPEMRMERRTVCGVDVFNDAYNANPESAVAAVRTFAALTRGAQRRIIVFGDMLELGDDAPGAHREVAQAILDAGCVDAVVAVGPLALHAADRLLRDWPEDRVHMIGDAGSDGARRIVRTLKPGDAVLLKASRAVGLERIVRTLEAREAGETEATLALERIDESIAG